MFKSIRFKLVIWHSITLLIILSVFSIIIYNNLKKNLYENIDIFLQLRGEGISDAIETYFEIQKIDINDTQKIYNKSFLNILNTLINQTYDPKLSSIEVKIIKPNGELISESKNALNIPDISEENLNELIKGNAIYDTFYFTNEEGKKYIFRYYATPAKYNGKIISIIQVWRPMFHTEFALKHLREIIILWVPLIVLLTMTVGMFFAKIALSPVHSIIETIKQITAENFKLRIKPPNTKDEIRELADIFNEMLNRLEDSFISQKRFIQDISHELKTPLTILKGELEVALRKARTPNEYAAILQSNLEETERIYRMIEDLLTLAKFDNREIKLIKEATDLKNIIETITKDMSREILKKNIRLEFQFTQDNFIIMADKFQIRRALLNIIDNAIKYSKENGFIKIYLYKEKKNIILKIEDNGIGIRESDLPNIFKRFYRADTSRSSPGFGLGLSITKNILDAHNYKIKIESEFDKGTVFTIIFS